MDIYIYDLIQKELYCMEWCNGLHYRTIYARNDIWRYHQAVEDAFLAALFSLFKAKMEGSYIFLVSLWIFLPWGVRNLYFASHKHPTWSCTDVISLCCSLKWLVHSFVPRSHHFRCLACATCPLFPLELVLLIWIPVFLSPLAFSGDLDILKLKNLTIKLQDHTKRTLWYFSKCE